MIIETGEKAYQRLIKKGDGSVLKGLRASKGGGRGCMAGGTVLLVFGVLFALPELLVGMANGEPVTAVVAAVCLIAPGLLIVVIGTVMRNRRNSSYMSFYMNETGFSEEELGQVDRELLAPDTLKIGYARSGSAGKSDRAVACFITEHYFVTEWYYVRRIEDMVAAAFSATDDIWGLVCLAIGDKDTHFETYNVGTDKKEALCAEIVNALKSRKEIIPVQQFALNGKQYDLKKNGKELLEDLRKANG